MVIWPLFSRRSNAAGEHFANLTDHMRVVDDVGVTRDRQFGRLGEHARTIIRDVSSLRDSVQINLERPEIARADQVDVRAGLYPFAKKDGLGRRGHRANHVGPGRGFLAIGVSV